MYVASWCCYFMLKVTMTNGPYNNKHKQRHKNTYSTVVRVFVSFCVFVVVRAILSWWPKTWYIYNVYNILSLNISLIYIIIMYNDLI